MSSLINQEFKSFLEDEHKLDSNFLYRKGLCGLSNIGNTCFMNSILQCINHTLPLTEYFMSNEWKDDLREDKPHIQLVEQWNNLSRTLWYRNSNITPANFFRVLINLIRRIGITQFQGFTQNDSQEFLQFFLDCLHTGLSREVVMNINGEVKDEIDKHAFKAFESWRTFFKNDFSKIIELFYSQFYQEVITIKNIPSDNNDDSKTSEIKTTTEISYLYEPFNSLSLEIPELTNENTKSLDIYDCLNNFTQKELIIETDEKKIYRHSFIWSLGEILIIFFKRFSFDYDSRRGHKKSILVNFPLDNLDLTPYVKGYCKDECVFNLYAVVNQVGSLNSGHYYSYIKNTDGNWYSFNDNIVSTLDTDSVVSENAYCLFYQKTQ